MNIEITLRPGLNEVAYFADVSFDDKISLLGCAIFHTEKNTFRVAMPSRKSKEGKHFAQVQLTPSLYALVETAVLEAINRSNHKG